MSEAPKKKTLVQKLAEVMGEVERVAKSGRNEFHRYDYATEADIVASVRMGMSSRGVMLIPSIEKIEWTERTDGKGKPVKIATLTVKFVFLDGDSDQKIEFIGMGQGEDASDKAIYKAMTGAEKYALLKTFLIPTGDDPEDDSPKQRNGAPAPQPQGSRTEALKGKLEAKRQESNRTSAPGSNPAMAIYEQMVVSCREYGVDIVKGLHPMIKQLCPKASTPKELTAADLSTIQKALKEAAVARDLVESKLNPPPHGDDDVPF